MKAIIIIAAIVVATFSVASAAYSGASKTVDQRIDRLKAIDAATMQ